MNAPEWGFSCAECFKKCDIFSALSDTELERIYQSRYETIFRPGEVLAKQGAPISNIISLSDGYAKVILETPGKPDIITTILKPTYLITSPGIFLDNRYHFSVVTLTPVKTCFIDLNVLHQLFRENQKFSKKFYQNIAERSILLYDRIRSLTQKNMAGRVSEALLFLHNHIFQTNPFKVLLNRQEMGEYTGLTKESVSRIFKEFKDEKIIDFDQEKVHILNMDRLIDIARKG